MGMAFTKLVLGYLFGKKEIRIMMVGLDGGGKTTILYKLKLGKIVTTIPTIGFNIESVEYKNINFNVWDLGAYDMVRHKSSLSPYYQNTQGLIFVVDSTERNCDRMVNARDHLHRLMLQEEFGLKDAALLVLANKQDRSGAMNVAEITDKLALHSLGLQHWYVQACSATSGDGLYEGLDWLHNNITNKA